MHADFLVIGAGIAGVSAADTLAARGRVIVLERESQPAYHTTGRSASYFTLNYGNDLIRALTKASQSFLTTPPDGFSAHPLMTPLGALTIARADQLSSFEQNLSDAQKLVPEISPITVTEARAMVPALRDDTVAAVHYEPDAQYMDVDLIHGGFLRRMRARGGELVCDAEVKALRRDGGTWHVATAAGTYDAPIVVNAAGAWADEIAVHAGLAPLGLVPKRRTVILFAAPSGTTVASWPLVLDVDEEFYFRGDAGKVLASPADATPSPPCDSQPEDLDIAVTVDRIETATTMTVPRIEHKWAGLRSFYSDNTPVVGTDPHTEGFVWLAGQGGYGIMTSPAMAEAACACATGDAWPESLAAVGVTMADLAADRDTLRSVTRD